MACALSVQPRFSPTPLPSDFSAAWLAHPTHLSSTATAGTHSATTPACAEPTYSSTPAPMAACSTPSGATATKTLQTPTAGSSAPSNQSTPPEHVPEPEPTTTKGKKVTVKKEKASIYKASALIKVCALPAQDCYRILRRVVELEAGGAKLFHEFVDAERVRINEGKNKKDAPPSQHRLLPPLDTLEDDLDGSIMAAAMFELFQVTVEVEFCANHTITCFYSPVLVHRPDPARLQWITSTGDCWITPYLHMPTFLVVPVSIKSAPCTWASLIPC